MSEQARPQVAIDRAKEVIEVIRERDELRAEVDVAWEQVNALREELMRYGHLPDCPFLLGGSADCWCPGVVPHAFDAIANNALIRKLLRAAFVAGAQWAVDDGDYVVMDTLRNHAHQAALCRWPEAK